MASAPPPSTPTKPVVRLVSKSQKQRARSKARLHFPSPWSGSVAVAPPESAPPSPEARPSPEQSGPTGHRVLVPDPSAASGAGALWGFSTLLYSLVGSSLDHPANDTGLAGLGKFSCRTPRAVRVVPGPARVLASSPVAQKGGEGVRAPDLPQAKASGQGRVSCPHPSHPCASSLCPGLFPPWPPISCSLGFPSGWLSALPKTPTRKLACCCEIMQMRFCSCPGNSSQGCGGAGQACAALGQLSSHPPRRTNTFKPPRLK